MSGSNITVGIVCSMAAEYEACRKYLKLSNDVKLGGRSFSSRVEDQTNIVSVESGPGKGRSASATQLIIDKFEPDVIIDVGGAGAISNKIDVFDIVCGKYAYEYNICDLEDFHYFSEDLTTNTILPDLSEEGMKVLQQFITKVRRKRSVEFKIGDIVSGERTINETSLRTDLYKTFKALACNWESYTVLETAKINGIKALSFRIITDRAGENMREEVKTNLEKALTVLFSILEEFFFDNWLSRLFHALPKTDQSINY